MNKLQKNLLEKTAPYCAWSKRRFHQSLRQLMFILFVILVGVGLINYANSGVAYGRTSSTSVPALKFKVGPAVKVIGPTADAADNLFNVIYVNGSYKGYTANSSTYVLEGPDIEQLSLNPTPVITRGITGNFDECGAWLQAFEQDGSIIRGWYHAEQRCDYNIWQSYKSVAYAESSDGGMSFTKPNYPNNQVLTAVNTFQPGQTKGLGDMSVIRWHSYYYMYYLDTDNPLWRTGVARAAVEDQGVPGTWYKWYNGQFSQPGLSGIGSTFSNIWATSISHYQPNDNLVLIGSDQWFGGLKLFFSPDGITWNHFSEPLVPFSQEDWKRDTTKGELIVYASIVPPSGGKSWDRSFYLFYTYIQPGEDFYQRYLVRRKVEVTAGAAGTSPQVSLALSSYYNATTNDHWTTTAMVPDQYTHENTNGYIFTKARKGLIELWDCSDAFTEGHKVVRAAEGCGINGKKLRTLGWVWKRTARSSVALYRCYNTANNDHFVSNSAQCDGLGQQEILLGYVER